jgi:hypothetical protein
MVRILSFYAKWFWDKIPTEMIPVYPSENCRFHVRGKNSRDAYERGAFCVLWRENL